MTTTICVKCKVAYRTTKTGVIVEEFAGLGSYKLWEADLKQCPKCQHQIVSGFAQRNFAEHFEEDYKEKLNKINKQWLYAWYNY